MSRKEARQFFISVEGVNCERLYFKHLAKLINASDSKYNMQCTCQKMSPISFAKRYHHLPDDKHNKKVIPYMHIQDIEDYQDRERAAQFKGLIDELQEVKKDYKKVYQLGYSNYTFELWMLLHVRNMNHAVQNRGAYLAPINTAFNRKFQNLDEYKSEKEFQTILDEFITLESVFKAIERAEGIVANNMNSGKRKENYKGIELYHVNPDLNVHDVIKLIFEICVVRKTV